MRRKQAVAALAAALAVGTAACGGGSGGGSASSGGVATGGSKTYTIGVIADLSGAAASGNKTAPAGVKAGTYYAARNGYTIKYIVADSGAGALPAAQKLVTEDHVLAVITHSALLFTAANYLHAHKVPVIGVAEDGPEWTKLDNMFSIVGALHIDKVATTPGVFFRQQGVTNVGTLGYGISPVSGEAALGMAKSAQAEGLKTGYVNAKFEFGSTNVEPVALAMKSGGVNGVVAYTEPNTAFALINSLRQNGVDLKVALLLSGYGGDTLQAGPGVLKEAQNVYFAQNYEPVEMNTPATRGLVADLRSAGVTGSPTFAEYNGYLSVALLVRALKAIPGTATQASLITELSKIHDWDALGLFGGHKLDINDRSNIVYGVDNCLWVSKLVGTRFQPVAGATPVCGKTLPGVTVSS